jgi:hypothetical protein
MIQFRQKRESWYGTDKHVYTCNETSDSDYRFAFSLFNSMICIVAPFNVLHIESIN